MEVDALVFIRAIQGFKDGVNYSRMLTALNGIEEEIDIVNTDYFRRLIKKYNLETERMEEIYGERFIEEYKNKRNRLMEIIGDRK